MPSQPRSSPAVGIEYMVLLCRKRGDAEEGEVGSDADVVVVVVAAEWRLGVDRQWLVRVPFSASIKARKSGAVPRRVLNTSTADNLLSREGRMEGCFVVTTFNKKQH